MLHAQSPNTTNIAMLMSKQTNIARTSISFFPLSRKPMQTHCSIRQQALHTWITLLTCGRYSSAEREFVGTVTDLVLDMGSQTEPASLALTREKDCTHKQQRRGFPFVTLLAAFRLARDSKISSHSRKSTGIYSVLGSFIFLMRSPICGSWLATTWQHDSTFTTICTGGAPVFFCQKLVQRT